MNNYVRILFLIFILNNIEIKSTVDEDNAWRNQANKMWKEYEQFFEKPFKKSLRKKMDELFEDWINQDAQNEIESSSKKIHEYENSLKDILVKSLYNKEELKKLKKNILDNDFLTVFKTTTIPEIKYLREGNICQRISKQMLLENCANSNPDVDFFDMVEDLSKICFAGEIRKDERNYALKINNNNDFVEKYLTESKEVTNRLIALLNNIDKAIEEAPE